MEENDKIKIVETLWRIIYSNNEADIYETSLMRRLGGLLYIDSKVMGEIKERIKKGAVFLVAEKVYLDDPVVQTLVHKMHVQDKRKSFTDKEILDKDTQLSVSMFCKTEKELTFELNQLGNVSKIWQSYNFMGFCVKL